MKIAQRVLAATFLVAGLPGIAVAGTGDVRPLTAIPSSVNFGPVLANDPDCQALFPPFPGCTEAVLMVTNTSGEPVAPVSQSVCTTIVLDPDSCEGGDWGGLTDSPPENTCNNEVIDPGETCQVTLIGLPSKTGTIRGFYVMGQDFGPFLLIVPVEILGSVNCLGAVATVVGTPGDDPSLGGTAGTDVIAGLRGNDVISGDPNDVVCGGPGIDEISGSGTALGGPGDDMLMGGAGDQVLFGGIGDDTVDPGAGNDRANGGEGDDTIIDGEAECNGVCDDLLSGGPGDDHIVAGAGDDRVFGGPGNDFISVADAPGHSDADFVNGGPGFDTCEVDPLDTYTHCEVLVEVPAYRSFGRTARHPGRQA
ncbi:MAG: calcium-binding protein [Actinomycetota bacterium]